MGNVADPITECVFWQRLNGSSTYLYILFKSFHCISDNYNVMLLVISIVCVNDVKQRPQKHETSTTGTGTEFFFHIAWNDRIVMAVRTCTSTHNRTHPSAPSSFLQLRVFNTSFYDSTVLYVHPVTYYATVYKVKQNIQGVTGGKGQTSGGCSLC